MCSALVQGSSKPIKSTRAERTRSNRLTTPTINAAAGKQWQTPGLMKGGFSGDPRILPMGVLTQN